MDFSRKVLFNKNVLCKNCKTKIKVCEIKVIYVKNVNNFWFDRIYGKTWVFMEKSSFYKYLCVYFLKIKVV